MALLLTHLLIAVSAANVVAAGAASFTSSSLSHVVSTTSARLPMSLSTVIQDLEAEGASHITTATYLTSKSVRRSEGSRLLGTLFGIASKNGEGDNEIAYGRQVHLVKNLVTRPKMMGQLQMTAGRMIRKGMVVLVWPLHVHHAHHDMVPQHPRLVPLS